MHSVSLYYNTFAPGWRIRAEAVVAVIMPNDADVGEVLGAAKCVA
jgi:hypothetical protein